MGGENSGMSGFVQGLDIFILSPSAFRLECISRADVGQYILQSLFFPVVSLVVFFVFIISRISPRLRVDGDKLLNTLLTVNQAFLISFANLSLLAFQCFDHFEGASTLIQYPQQFCYEDDHSYFIVLSMWMVFTVILPFNVLFLFAVFKVYAHNKNISVSMRAAVKFKLFFQKWRPERWYWGYVFTWRQMLFACIFAISNDAFVQLFMVIAVLNVYNMFLAALRPWRLLELNIFEFALNLVFVVLLLSQFPERDSHLNASSFQTLSFVLTVVYFCIIGGCVLRVCLGFAFAGSPNKKFNYFPKPVDDQVLQDCFDRMRKVNFNHDFFKFLSEYEINVVVSFFELLEKETFSEFGFPVGVGARMFIPNEITCDPKSRNEIVENLRAKSIENESYI